MLKRVIFLLFVMIALLSCEKDWNNPFDPNSDKFQEFVIDNTSLDFGVATRYDTTSRETKIYNNTEDKFILLETTSSSPYFKPDPILILGGLYHRDLPDSLYIVTAFNSFGIPTTYFKVNDIYNKNLKIAFTPTEIKNYSETITVKASYCSYVVNTLYGLTYVTLKDIKSIGQKSITVSGTGSNTAVSVDLISVASIDMEFVPKNKQKSQKICITNSTSYPLTITGINYPACFSGADTLSLPANSSDSLEITFSPTENDKDYRGIVTITSSGNLQDTFSVMATSNFGSSIFSYDSTDLGYVPLSRSKTQKLVIKNNTDCSINITNITYPSCFSGVSSLSVPASDSTYLSVTFTPTSANIKFDCKLILITEIDMIDTVTLKGTSKFDGSIFTLGNTDFVYTAQGNSLTQKISIKNNTNYPINITNITYPSCFSGANSLSMSAKGIDSLSVTFAPTATAVYKDSLGLTTNTGITEKHQLYGTSKSSIIWQHDAGGMFRGGASIGDNGTIYIANCNGYTYAFNKDGSIKWKYFKSAYTNYNPITIDKKGNLYISYGNGGSYFSLDNLGKLRWQISQKITYANPSLGNDGTLYTTLGDSLYAHNSDDGSEKWNYNIGGKAVSSIGSDGTIYVPGGTNLYAFTSNGGVKWKVSVSGVKYAPAIGNDGILYLYSTYHILYAITKDGMIKWQKNIIQNSGGLIYSHPTIDKDGTIYVGSFDSNTSGNGLYAINSDGSLKWHYHTGTLTYTSATIGNDGLIYFVDEAGWFYALNNDGRLNWKYKVGSRFLDAFVVLDENGIAYIGDLNGVFYAVQTTSKGYQAGSPWPKRAKNNRSTGNANDE